MEKEEQLAKRAEALKLYLSGMAVNRLATTLDVNVKSVQDWIKKYHWKEKLNTLTANVEKDIIEDVEAMKKKHYKVINKTVEKFLTELEKGNVKVNAGDAAKMLQHELELRLPKEVKYNFEKEININVNLPELLQAIRNGKGRK